VPETITAASVGKPPPERQISRVGNRHGGRVRKPPLPLYLGGYSRCGG
jgi:hypothetical protein